MKYNNDVLQAAIDTACEETAKGPFRPMRGVLAMRAKDNPHEANSRLALAKAFLTALPPALPAPLPIQMLAQDQVQPTAEMLEAVNAALREELVAIQNVDKVKTPRTNAIIAADTGDSGFITELAKLSRSLEEKNTDLKEALEKAKEFVKSWGEIVDTQYSLWNECMAAINKVLK